MSSIYTFYDPDYKFLTLGHVTAVREIEFMMKLRENGFPNLKYYYMGFFVYDCPKTSYKQSMHPQMLLCPKTWDYVYLTDDLIAQIDKEKFLQLSDISPKKTIAMTEEEKEELIKETKIYYREDWLPLSAVAGQMQTEFVKNLAGISEVMGRDLLSKFVLDYK